jgi:phosphatidylserine/phosphatidylglycerophosphate/cardiolipin synthase-like enzyme
MIGTTDPLVELVLTVPEPYGGLLAYNTRCRTTIGVLIQLITEAERFVIIAAPFIQSAYGLSTGVIADALSSALRRGVDIDVMSTSKGLQAIDREQLMHAAKGRLRFFQPVPHRDDEQQLGSHAKFCIADGERAYVGSANLTYHGLSGQVEMGLLIRGSVAHQIKDFWDYAVEVGLYILSS